MDSILNSETPEALLVAFFSASWREVLGPWCTNTVAGEIVLLISRLRDAEDTWGPYFQAGRPPRDRLFRD